MKTFKQVLRNKCYNPLCPRIHKYKKMQFPDPLWQVQGNGAHSSPGLSPRRQQPKPSKQINKQRQQKYTRVHRKSCKLNDTYFSIWENLLLTRKLSSFSTFSSIMCLFFLKSRKNFPAISMLLKSWQSQRYSSKLAFVRTPRGCFLDISLHWLFWELLNI